MKSHWLFSGLLVIGILATTVSFMPAPEKFVLKEDQSVYDILQRLGAPPANHLVDNTVEGASGEHGRELVHVGITAKPSGGKTSKQSAHFVCTSCHNMERETADLSKADPQARLEYVKANNLPFLQGSALYGAVNRSSFYNGDYEKKYGDLVVPARNNLREAIQLCAIECSQGRRLEAWEMESILAYLWTIDLKIKDLLLTKAEQKKIEQALNKSKTDKQAVIDLIQSKYLSGAPATFVTPPDDRKTGYSVTAPNPDNGKDIYDLSCLHCHEGKRYSYFNLDHAKTTFKFLEKHFSRYTRYSTYQVTRYGTSPMPGKRAYMPNYTLEKLSDQQVEDLRAYIHAQAMDN
ncbi:MAG: c-type cytochrome [Phaeodactylibacter sp.]|nr:c-type cytochrome [Phaeodactylibacter sp.]